MIYYELQGFYKSFQQIKLHAVFQSVIQNGNPWKSNAHACLACELGIDWLLPIWPASLLASSFLGVLPQG